MKRSEHSHFIQADARGRIQLPKELRGFRLFKLGAKDGKYELIPLRVEEQVLSHLPEELVPSIWLAGEVEDYCQRVLFQKIREHFAVQSDTPVRAIFLYGSRARKDALSQSDFDFGLLCDRYPNSQERHLISDKLQAVISEEFKEMRKHGVEAEPSFHFFSSQISEEMVSPIYFAITTDARSIWSEGNSWEVFINKIKKIMKIKKVKPIGDGKNRIWTWEKL